MSRSKPVAEDESLRSELLSSKAAATKSISTTKAATRNTKTRFAVPQEGRDARNVSRSEVARSRTMRMSGSAGAAGAAVTATKAVKAVGVAGKGTVRLVGKGVGVAGKGTAKGAVMAGKGTVYLGTKTGKGALNATKLVAKNTKKVGTVTVGAARNLPGNAIDVAGATVKGVTNLPGNAIHLAGQTVKGVNNLAARTLKRNEDVAEAAAWKTRATSRATKIEVRVSCRNLRRKDAFAESDAFAVLWQVPSGYGLDASVGRMGDESFSTMGSVALSSLATDGSKQRKRPRVNRLPAPTEKEIARTEVIKGNKNPEFTNAFILDFRFQEEQTYVIRVYDSDLEFCQDLKEHDFLGGTIFSMGDLLGAGKRIIRRPLRARGDDQNKSMLYIQGSEVKSTRSVFEFRFSGEDLKVKDAVIEKEDDLFFTLLKHDMKDQTWKPVYKSEVVMHNNTPSWANARIPLPELCNDDIRNPLKFVFWEWFRGGQSEELGKLETTCQILVEEAARGIPVFDAWKEKKRTFARRAKTKKQGRVKVLRAEIKQVPSLLEYIGGGCKLDVSIAVDCSMHNWDPDAPGGSLHNSPGPMGLNDYQAVINKIGGVLDPYSLFSLWGFGATLRGEETTLFPMGYDDGTVKGASGLLDAYDTTFIDNPHYMEPAEDVNIAPLIRSAMYRAIQKSEVEHCYSVLCILTAGRIGDLQYAVDTVCTAAEDAPLSIVIIGIGDNVDEFEDIKVLLANGGKLRHSNGVPIARDIVAFASFNEFEGSAGQVVAEAFKDLPEQVVEYFTSNGIQPRPPLSSKEEMSTSMKDSSKGTMGGSSRRQNSHLRSNRKSRSPKRGSPKRATRGHDSNR